jgi:hypothetical protein
MASDNKKHETPKYYHPPNVLRQKVGIGGMPEELIARAEQFIQDNQFNFKPTAIEIMKRFNAVLAKAKDADVKDKKLIDRIGEPIMELKANGDMFSFSLLTEVSEILLNFLENIHTLDDDSFHVIEAHKNTIDVIIKNDLRGSGGAEGHALSRELYAACNRYYTKHKIELGA